MVSRFHRPGELLRVTRVQIPDPDSYAVIHMEGGFAFPATYEWVQQQKPEVGGYIAVRENRRVFVRADEQQSFNDAYRRSIIEHVGE